MKQRIFASILFIALFTGCKLESAEQFGIDDSCNQNDLLESLNHSEVLIGDMLLPVSDVYYKSDLYEFWPDKAAALDNSVNSFGTTTLFLTLWDDGILPIEVADGVSQDLVNKVFAACDKISEVADVTCKLRDTETYYVRLTANSGGCYATVGRSFGGSLNLPGRCNIEAVIIHELMHNLGIKHEHQHPDRDTYVRVIEENVRSGSMSNFVKVSSGGIISDFDSESIMIYRSDAFSVGSTRPALVKRSPTCDAIESTGFPSECLIPFHYHMSDGDKLFLAQLYGATTGTPNPPPPPPVEPPSPPTMDPPTDEPDTTGDDEPYLICNL